MEVTLSPWGGRGGGGPAEQLTCLNMPDFEMNTARHKSQQRTTRLRSVLMDSQKALDLTAPSNLLSERGAPHSGQQTGNQAEPVAGSPSLPELITSAHGENNIKSPTFLIQGWRRTEPL